MCKNYNIEQKQCLRCKINKDIKSFKIINNTILDWCLDCCDSYEKNLTTKKQKYLNIPEVNNGYKFCLQCSTTLPITKFSKNNETKDKLAVYCKSCSYKMTKIIREAKKNNSFNKKTKLENCIECGDNFSNKGNICNYCLKTIRKLKLYKLSEKNKKKTISNEITQTCKKCNCVKNISMFKKNNNYTTGYSYSCKECIVSSRKTKRDRTKETKYNKLRLLTDPIFQTMTTIHSSVYSAFKSKKLNKNKTCDEYGIDRKYIADTLGYRPVGFHLDHIIPINAFNFNIIEHIKLCYSVENLRWCSAKENSEKTDKIIWPLIKKNEKLLYIAKMLGINEEFNNMRICDLKKQNRYG